MLSRRLALRLLAAVGLLSVPARRSSMAAFFSRPKDKAAPRTPRDVFTEGGKSLVGVSGFGSPAEMVREAVSLIGGFGRLGIKGKTVLVKPNVVSGKPSPATTNPALVASVVRVLFEEGARQVVVGDMSAMMTLSTARNMRSCGIWAAAEGAGARVVAFEDYGWIEVDLAGARYVAKAYVTEWLYRADLVVNLPVIKTHRSASYSACLKNFVGCTHLRQRPYLIDSDHWEELVAEFNLAYRPDVNIVDGTVSMISGGPWEGEARHTRLVMASGDRVAADAVGVGVIKSFGKWPLVADKEVWDQRQLRHALVLGVGVGRERISLRVGHGDDAFQRLIGEARRHAGL